jgi:hypothetical protein
MSMTFDAQDSMEFSSNWNAGVWKLSSPLRLALDAEPWRHCGALRANRARRFLGPTRTAWTVAAGAGEVAVLGNE